MKTVCMGILWAPVKIVHPTGLLINEPMPSFRVESKVIAISVNSFFLRHFHPTTAKQAPVTSELPAKYLHYVLQVIACGVWNQPTGPDLEVWGFLRLVCLEADNYVGNVTGTNGLEKQRGMRLAILCRRPWKVQWMNEWIGLYENNSQLS